MAHIARKRFGQNFLSNYNIIAQIIGSINIQPEQHWVEIGPGQGALTEPLLASGARLDVVELDRDLVQLLRQKFPAQDNLKIHSCDALKFNFSELADSSHGLNIIGNLPYNISTPLLFHLLESSEFIDAMYFMLQKEVVDRICAQPGSKKYGRLSVMLQYFCATEFLFEVPPESFSPAPKVMSAVVKLMPHDNLPVPADNFDLLNSVVIQAFSQRRKTLRNSLKKLLCEEEMINLNIDPTLRAESITLQQFVALSNFLHAKNSIE